MRSVFLTLILFFFALDAQAAESTVTIPLIDYMGLIKQSEPEKSFTSVEDILVTGTHGKTLSLSIAGTASRKPQSVAVMPFSKDFRISNCKGNANLSVDGAKVFVLPSSKKFSLKCDLFANDWEKPMQLSFMNTVSAQVNIEGAEATMIPGTLGFNYNILPKDRSPATVAGVKPKVKAFYKITLSKEDNRFEYKYQIYNPNTSVVEFNLQTPNNEKVSRVTTRSKYEAIEGGYKLVLKPGDNQVWLAGAFPGETWKPNSESQLSYLLIDQHPLISSKVQSKARQVSPQETQMRAVYPAPKAFLLTNAEDFKWSKSELDAFTAQTYSVENANYHYYWSPKGTSLVEANFRIQNQSATEFALDIPGTPTYLAINGTPLNLTKNEADQLVIKLRPNQHQNLEIQYQLNKSPSRIFASVSEDLVRPATTISNTQLTFTTPENHKPIWYALASDSHWSTFWAEALKSLLILFPLWFLVRRMKVYGLWKQVFPLSVAALVFLVPSLFFWTVLGCLFLILASYRQQLSSSIQKWNRWDYARLGVFTVLIVLVWNMLGTADNMLANVSMEDQSYAMAEYQKSAPQARALVSPKSKSRRMMGKKGSAIAFGAGAPMMEESMGLEADVASDSFQPSSSNIGDDTYKGLPAKIRMPSGGVHHVLQEKLSASGEELRFSAITISNSLPKFCIFFFAVLALFSVYKLKDDFVTLVKNKVTVTS